MAAGFVTFRFDDYFVKCFWHGTSVIFQFERHTSNSRECYCTSRHNNKINMLSTCVVKKLVIFVGGAFSLVTSIHVLEEKNFNI